MSIDSTGVLFDSVLKKEDISHENIGISIGGDRVVSSSDRATFIENIDPEVGLPPIELFDKPSDCAGFFGKKRDIIAVAIDDLLMIIDANELKMLKKMWIIPKSAHIPSTGNSEKIGAVSPNGTAFTIDEDCVIRDTGMKIPEGKEVLWSSSSYPAGYVWIEEGSANVYIRSKSDEKGSVVSTTNGITIFGVWANSSLKRHEVYLSTYDKPNILKRVTSSPKGAVVENIVEFRKDVTISNLTSFADGRPAVVSGNSLSLPVSKIIPPSKKLSELISRTLTSSKKSSTIKCSGKSTYISWSQTPITPPKPSVVNYGIAGRPEYEIMGSKRTKDIFEEPAVNEVKTIIAADKSKINYRVISRFPISTHMATECAIVPDYYGHVASGMFSPTIKMLYDLGITVILVPVNRRKKTRKTVINDLTYDLLDVSEDIKKKKISKESVLFLDRITTGSLNIKKMVAKPYFREIVIIDGLVKDLSFISKWKRYHNKVLYISLNEDIKNLEFPPTIKSVDIKRGFEEKWEDVVRNQFYKIFSTAKHI